MNEASCILLMSNTVSSVLSLLTSLHSNVVISHALQSSYKQNNIGLKMVKKEKKQIGQRDLLRGNELDQCVWALQMEEVMDE